MKGRGDDHRGGIVGTDLLGVTRFHLGGELLLGSQPEAMPVPRPRRMGNTPGPQ
jgi:hypothetical protein